MSKPKDSPGWGNGPSSMEAQSQACLGHWEIGQRCAICLPYPSRAFVSGGAQTGLSSDNVSELQLQNYTSVSLGSHFLRFGEQFRHAALLSGDLPLKRLTVHQVQNLGEVGATAPFALARRGPHRSDDRPGGCR